MLQREGHLCVGASLSFRPVSLCNLVLCGPFFIVFSELARRFHHLQQDEPAGSHTDASHRLIFHRLTLFYRMCRRRAGNVTAGCCTRVLALEEGCSTNVECVACVCFLHDCSVILLRSLCFPPSYNRESFFPPAGLSSPPANITTSAVPSIVTPIVNGFTGIPHQPNGHPAVETVYTNGLPPYSTQSPNAADTLQQAFTGVQQYTGERHRPLFGPLHLLEDEEDHHCRASACSQHLLSILSAAIYPATTLTPISQTLPQAPQVIQQQQQQQREGEGERTLFI